MQRGALTWPIFGFPLWYQPDGSTGYHYHNGINDDGIDFAGKWITALAERRERQASGSSDPAWPIAANHEVPPKVITTIGRSWDQVREALDDPEPIRIPSQECLDGWLKQPEIDHRFRLPSLDRTAQSLWVSKDRRERQILIGHPSPLRKEPPTGLTWVAMGSAEATVAQDIRLDTEINPVWAAWHFAVEGGRSVVWSLAAGSIQSVQELVLGQHPDWAELPQTVVLVHPTAAEVTTATTIALGQAIIVTVDGHRIPEDLDVALTPLLRSRPARVIIERASRRPPDHVLMRLNDRVARGWWPTVVRTMELFEWEKDARRGRMLRLQSALRQVAPVTGVLADLVKIERGPDGGPPMIEARSMAPLSAHLDQPTAVGTVSEAANDAARPATATLLQMTPRRTDHPPTGIAWLWWGSGDTALPMDERSTHASHGLIDGTLLANQGWAGISGFTADEFTTARKSTLVAKPTWQSLPQVVVAFHPTIAELTAIRRLDGIHGVAMVLDPQVIEPALPAAVAEILAWRPSQAVIERLVRKVPDRELQAINETRAREWSVVVRSGPAWDGTRTLAHRLALEQVAAFLKTALVAIQDERELDPETGGF